MTPTAAADEVADAAPVAPAPTPAATAALTLHMSGVALPGAAAPASLDYIAVDRAAGRMWVPVGNTGSVDVFDIAKGTFTRVDGFATAEREGETENGRSDPAP